MELDGVMKIGLAVKQVLVLTYTMNYDYFLVLVLELFKKFQIRLVGMLAL